MKIPQYARLMKSAEEFWELSQDIVHVALKRSRGLYYHHCIISSYFDAKNGVYEYFVPFKNLLSGSGAVLNRNVNTEKIEKAIKNCKLYVIEAPNYPKSKEEKENAKKRFWERWNEKLYSLASNNCEHLVSYILTGNPYSEQIQKLGAWGMAFIDSFDALIIHGKRAMLRMSGCLIAIIPARIFVKLAAKEVINVATHIINTPTASAASPGCQVDRCAENICNVAGKSSQFTKTQLLASKECAEVAKVAGKQAFKRTAKTTFAVSAVVEAGFAAYDIYKLDELREKGRISERDCKRETTKSVGGAVCATGGSVAGGVIGQVICPVPVLGFAIGSTVGNVIGRAVGSPLFGFLFDEW